MKRVFSLLAVLTVSMFFCIATAGGAFAADKEVAGKHHPAADICNACNKVIRALIIASDAASCPVIAAEVAVGCEAAIGPITEGAGTVICAGIGVAVDIVCAEAGGAKKLREDLDKNILKICKKVKACK